MEKMAKRAKEIKKSLSRERLFFILLPLQIRILSLAIGKSKLAGDRKPDIFRELLEILHGDRSYRIPK